MALEALTQYAKVASGVRATVNLKVKAKAGTQEKAFRPIEANTVFGMQHWEVIWTGASIPHVHPSLSL